MPELPEVERARKLIQDSCKGYKISSVETTEDKIVYTGGTDHAQFAKELEGRTITGCERKGKTFWITLSGEGRLPVLHFGMTGMVQLKGQEPTWYRRRPRERSDSWPPRFWKFVVKLEPQDGSVSQEPRELAFMDGRRLARLRLLPSPVTDHAPVSLLGFDPILSHPTLEEFKALIEKKKGTTKGMIMNQAFSAGVGNWVADEVLYQARIHPSCPVNLLTDQNVKDLHFQLRNICQTAVDVNADHMKFPSDWLFRWRWSKGQKQQKATKARQKALESGSDEEGGEDLKPKGMKFLALPDGSPATITFIEVSGRTTAVVSELQKMPEGVEIKPKITKGGKGSQSKKSKGDSDDEGSSGSNSSEENEVKPKTMTPRQKAAMAAKKAKLEASSPSPVKMEPESTKRKAKDEVKLEPTEESTTPSKKPRKSANGRPSGDGGRSKPGRKGRGGKAKRPEDSDSSELSDAPE